MTISFIPLLFDTMGGWYYKATEQIKNIARPQSMSTAKEKGDTIRHRLQHSDKLSGPMEELSLLNTFSSFFKLTRTNIEYTQ